MAKTPKPAGPAADKNAAKPKKPRAKKAAPEAAAPFVPRIVVKNFGPLKDVDLELKDFMVFIGPQASGKSTLAKLVGFYYLMPALIEENYDTISRENNPAMLMYMIMSYFKRTLLDGIVSNSNLSVEYIYPSGRVCFIYTDKLYVNLSPQILDSLIETAKSGGSISKELLSQLGVRPGYGFLIPAERAKFSHFSKSDLFQDPFYEAVSTSYAKSKKVFANSKITDSNIEYHIFSLDGNNNAHFRSIIKNESIVFTKDGNIAIPVDEKFATEPILSSGQRSVIPLFIILDSFMHSPKGDFTWAGIEEPELHLFPDSQYQVVSYFAKIHNKTSAHFQLTTHSPYILTSLNNLLYAGKLAKEQPEKEKQIAEFVPKEQWLDPDRFSAFYVDEGGIRNILDYDPKTKQGLGTIDADEIDKISETIGNTMGKLIKLKFKK